MKATKMPRYMILFKANPSAWQADPKQALAEAEKTFAGGDQYLKAGWVEEIGFFTNTFGYAITEQPSIDKVLGLVAPFFPWFTQEIYEIATWEKAKESILAGLRAAASAS